MTVTNRNLLQHREQSSVWDRQAPWDGARWLTAAAAGACLVVGSRRRSAAGLLLSMAGGVLAWWACASGQERRASQEQLVRAIPGRRRTDDLVDDASMESFPASDPPAWTSSAGGPDD